MSGLFARLVLLVRRLSWLAPLLPILPQLLRTIRNTQPPEGEVYPNPDLEHKRELDEKLLRLRRQVRRARLLAAFASLIALGALAWIIGGRHQQPPLPPVTVEQR